jgi:hypothetical protein
LGAVDKGVLPGLKSVFGPIAEKVVLVGQAFQVQEQTPQQRRQNIRVRGVQVNQGSGHGEAAE